MERLTKKDNNGQYFSIAESKTFDEEQQCINKLGRYEDIEEKFGCDFIFLDNVCSNGVYCYEQSIKDCDSSPKGNIVYIPSEDIHVNFFGICKEQRMGVVVMGCLDYVYHSLRIKDYGKTWALTKEELK